ncbi:magnesium transporter [Pseudomonas sp. RIT-PI-S]|uniref:magnesium transporter n=1 Tax=Pseudomonas sp. RIT-PI-S TaxID=3035295 RepID=UPI0021DB7092|nr:magnesium transporter [Pseudomonas sp. RIT-PI-S]
MTHTLFPSTAPLDQPNVATAAKAQLAADIARYLALMNCEAALETLGRVDLAKRAEVFGYLPLARQVELTAQMPRVQLARLVSAMSADERADLFQRLGESVRGTLLTALAQAERDDLLKLSAHREGTAGAIMTSEYCTVDAAMSVADAIASLRRSAPEAETIYQAYVLDAQRRLAGVLSLRDLVLAEPGASVASLASDQVVSAPVGCPQERVARLISDYDLLALPIVNDDQQLVGIVTCDDAMDVVVDEATEDFHKGASIATHIGNLRDATVGLLYRKRVLWLVLLVFGNLFSGAGIAAFEDVIAANIALVFFLPLLVDSGGNAGAQSATLMVRALATGEVVLRDWVKLLGRECLVALALGITMAAAVALLGVMRGGPDIAVIVASSMVIIVMVGSVIGMSLPFLLSRLRMDPATASGPLITSIADAAGVLVYFAIASQVLEL